MHQFQNKYNELEAQFASKMSSARDKWRAKYIKIRNEAGKENLEKELAKLTEEYTTRTNNLLHQYTVELMKHTDRQQSELK